MRPTLADTMPAALRGDRLSPRAVHVAWAAGPSFVASKSERFASPVAIQVALDWLERDRTTFRVAVITLDDGRRLFFERGGFRSMQRGATGTAERARPTASRR